jgi:predicted DCC family thiol-disulfide oxidoreductase YuxK
MEKPTLIYDGDCAFCRAWIERWKLITGDRVAYEPSQSAGVRYPEIPSETFKRSVQLVAEDGTVYGGAEAVFRSLAVVPEKRWMLRFYKTIPGAAPAAEILYRYVAGHRDGFFTLTRLLWGKTLEPPSYDLTRWLFLRLVGIIYLVAFVSLGTQILGLVGSNGIQPVENYIRYIHQNLGAERYFYYPTLAWLSASDAFLQFLSWGGAGLSMLLVIGIAPAATSALLWIFYLSLFIAGQSFLSFQWDILLLETGFLTIFFAQAQILPGLSRACPPSAAVLWLFRLLLFRLMFFSGFVKLASGDLSWHNLTTLTFHYETQPLPTPVAWYAHQLPLWLQKTSVAIMFVIELAVPFLIFTPRRLRLAASGAIALLMVLIIITGNYTFFNLLALSLCVLLLDDRALRMFIPSRILDRVLKKILPGQIVDRALKRILPENAVRRTGDTLPRSRLNRLALTSLAVIILSLNCFQFARLVFQRELPAPVTAIARWCSPFYLVNHYGLFAVMTNPRNEIIVEGSDDGTTWREYGFRYKPGDVMRAPGWVAPHQPRLDWQMWFAALGNYQSNPWFVNFCVRLLQSSPGVLDLIEKNPFPDKPPRVIRALLYEYHFTDFSTRATTGAWWRRELKGVYMPPIQLRE